jgi:hypothetical protein
MSRIEDLKQQIQSLSPEELAELRDWFWELDGPAAPAELRAEPDANPGQLVEDVMAKIRKHQ